MNHTIPASLVGYQQTLEEAIRRDLAAAGARRRRRRVVVRFLVAGGAAAAVGLGALNLLDRGAPSTAQPAAAAIIRGAAAAITPEAPRTILHVKFTGWQDNGDGTSVTWGQESFSEQRPPFDSRLINTRLPGTPPGVEQSTVNGLSQLYDPTRNTIYIGPPPTTENLHHYVFRPGPTPGTSRVRVPVAYRVGVLHHSGARQVRPSVVWRTVVVTTAEAKALRDGTDVVVWKVTGKGDRIGRLRVVRAPRRSSANDASNLDPFSATFRTQILALLRSGHARVAGRATVDGRDTIKIEAADGHTTYYVAPGSYRPVELTTKGTSGGTILRFDSYEELPAVDNSKLLSLSAQHPNAVIDRNAADYRAAEARLFPHG
jgi:hypothetical protein